ncbi:MAG: PucR family transcriptional regulator ligand-binding domain-containing protein, partial [Lachnospiraceae bacterium]|nr:PucR family transcriptional regulator ligand-binding domain-containing protein [Lachnospiraceae bacterium]
HLYSSNGNPFQLQLVAGENGADSVVSWIYMMEDEYVLSYFHGSELIVTTGMRQAKQPGWLLETVKSLCARHAAGLIVNVGMFVFEIPQPVLDFCDQNDFPLLLMPWEIPITEMTQGLCIAIMNSRQESLIHDQAIRDAILRPDKVSEYQEILATYYDLDADFIVITICFQYRESTHDASSDEEPRKASIPETDSHIPSASENWFETNLRRMKKRMNIPKTRIGVVGLDHLQLVIINHSEPSLLDSICDIILEAYRDTRITHDLFIGIGQPVTGIEEIHKSFQRAATAMQMAIHRKQTVIDFNEMGFDKILFSVKDEQVLSSYADEILGPIEQEDRKGHAYVALLRAYIRNDRSLEGTARELYIHRNTVNYQVQKMRVLLNSPLKTAADLFPFQVALAIRDM